MTATEIERNRMRIGDDIEDVINTAADWHNEYDGIEPHESREYMRALLDREVAHAVAMERERIAASLVGDWLTCPNCDGRTCLGCVFREWGHQCANDCPDCCIDGQEIPVGTRVARAIRNGEHWKDHA